MYMYTYICITHTLYVLLIHSCIRIYVVDLHSCKLDWCNTYAFHYICITHTLYIYVSLIHSCLRIYVVDIHSFKNHLAPKTFASLHHQSPQQRLDVWHAYFTLHIYMNILYYTYIYIFNVTHIYTHSTLHIYIHILHYTYITQKSPIYTQKSPTYTLKRALQTFKRA